MITLQPTQETKRLTATEEVFQQLRADIISLRLAPGTKISEVELAKAYDVSRQPVREAFMRLRDLNLLEIRPQRATRVRKISLGELRNTRFIREAVEVEVVRVASRVAQQDSLDRIAENLNEQRQAIEAGDAERLKALDYQFHGLICDAAELPYAFRIIAENKAHTDRACTLELATPEGMREVLEGHAGIFEALCARDEELAVARTRAHLRHLDGTLKLARENFPEFFED